MRAAWRPDDVRVAEERLMESVPDGELMRRAAAALARRCALVLSGMGRVYGSRVLVLVGAGNNGGDALFAGALLARRGASVVAMLTAPDRAHPGGLADFRAAGGMLTALLPELSHVDLIVDGIVGIGARGGLRGPAAHIASEVDRLRGAVPVVAVDVPSGVDVTTGAVCGPAIRADVTVTFGCLKPGLVVGPAATLAGEIEVVDIGLGPHLTAPPVLRVPATVDIARWWPRPGPNSDKYRRGVAGLSTGSGRFPGAAMLSTAGALAGPAGLVRYAGPTGSAVVAAHPSVVVSSGVAEAGRVQAWLCGCGLGTDEGARTELDAVLAHPVPVVLDADALTLLAADGVEQTLRRRPGRRSSPRTTASSFGSSAAEAACRGMTAIAPIRSATTGSRPRRRSPSGSGRWFCSRETGPSWPCPDGRRGSTRPARRRWQRPAPAMCWRACSCRCSRPAWRRIGQPSAPPICTVSRGGVPREGSPVRPSPPPTSRPVCRA